MKTLMTITIFALVATFSLSTGSPAWAHPAAFPHAHMNPPTPMPSGKSTWGCKGPGCKPSASMPTGGGTWGCKGPGCKPSAKPTKQPNPTQPQVHHHYHRSRGASWGAFAGGTALGLVMGTMANQPQQTTQPTVVYVQQPNGDATEQQQYLEQEIERERSKRIALEQELERLRAERQ